MADMLFRFHNPSKSAAFARFFGLVLNYFVAQKLFGTESIRQFALATNTSNCSLGRSWKETLLHFEPENFVCFPVERVSTRPEAQLKFLSVGYSCRRGGRPCTGIRRDHKALVEMGKLLSHSLSDRQKIPWKIIQNAVWYLCALDVFQFNFHREGFQTAEMSRLT